MQHNIFGEEASSSFVSGSYFSFMGFDERTLQQITILLD